MELEVIQPEESQVIEQINSKTYLSTPLPLSHPPLPSLGGETKVLPPGLLSIHDIIEEYSLGHRSLV